MKLSRKIREYVREVGNGENLNKIKIYVKILRKK